MWRCCVCQIRSTMIARVNAWSWRKVDGNVVMDRKEKG